MSISYNMNAELGVDDMEVVEEFNLNPDLAYTPELNEVVMQEVYNQNIDAIRARLIREGVDVKEARHTAISEANVLKMQGDRALKALYKQRKKK